MPVTRRNCDWCEEPYDAKRPSSRFCKTSCRVAANKAGQSASKVVSIRPGEGPVARAYRAKFQELGQGDSPEAAAAAALATQLDTGRDTGSAKASLSRQLQALLDAARAVGDPPSEISELKAWRDRTRASIG